MYIKQNDVRKFVICVLIVTPVYSRATLGCQFPRTCFPVCLGVHIEMTVIGIGLTCRSWCCSCVGGSCIPALRTYLSVEQVACNVLQ